jgi:predicted AAA+ superfamily ATPase
MAHCHGQVWNASKIAVSLDVSSRTVRRYLDLLQDVFMVRQVQPYTANTKKRVIKSAKVYLRDTGLLHALLGIGSFDALQGHPALGASWEGFAVEQIHGLLPAGSTSYFYRTCAGAEVDLVIERGPSDPPVAVECKYSLSPRLARGFWNALDDIQPAKAYVVYPGQEPYPLAKQVWAWPLSRIAEVFE